MTDAAGFRADIDRVPETLLELAAALEHERMWSFTEAPRRLLLLGMGSSHYAADVCAVAPTRGGHRRRRRSVVSRFDLASIARARGRGDLRRWYLGRDTAVALLTEPLVAELLAAEWWGQ